MSVPCNGGNDIGAEPYWKSHSCKKVEAYACIFDMVKDWLEHHSKHPEGASAESMLECIFEVVDSYNGLVQYDKEFDYEPPEICEVLRKPLTEVKGKDIAAYIALAHYVYGELSYYRSKSCVGVGDIKMFRATLDAYSNMYTRSGEMEDLYAVYYDDFCPFFENDKIKYYEEKDNFCY